MQDSIDDSQDSLKENEVRFFLCKKCGSRSLYVSQTVEIKETIEKVLLCTCGGGKEMEAVYRTEQVIRHFEEIGYLAMDRHVILGAPEEYKKDYHKDEDEVICPTCYKAFCNSDVYWSVNERYQEKTSDLTITCEGCGREIEFGYLDANSQDRIFLGEDDTEFVPWKATPDVKYRRNVKSETG
jgi:RNase P subunit RPR2